MTESDLRALICRCFLDGDTDFPFDLDTDLFAEGICDSLGAVQLASELEKKVGTISISDQEISRENFRSMREILSLVQRKLGA